MIRAKDAKFAKCFLSFAAFASFAQPAKLRSGLQNGGSKFCQKCTTFRHSSAKALGEQALSSAFLLFSASAIASLSDPSQKSIHRESTERKDGDAVGAAFNSNSPVCAPEQDHADRLEQDVGHPQPEMRSQVGPRGL